MPMLASMQITDKSYKILQQKLSEFYTDCDIKHLFTTRCTMSYVSDEGTRGFVFANITANEQNKIILEELSSKLVERFGDQYVASELFLMQKLFLLYPKKSPTDLLSLSWEHVKFLLNIFDKKERAFYIQECLQRNWDLEKLKEMYFQDTYKKYNNR